MQIAHNGSMASTKNDMRPPYYVAVGVVDIYN